MEAGTNCFEKEHLKLNDLRDRPESSGNTYLIDNGRIPKYPRPEIHVSHLKHDTDRQGLEGIKQSGGFKGKHDLVWWGLVVGGEELRSAEQRLLQETYPDRTEQQVQDQQSFLGKFASSPAFKKSPTFGSYCFTFPLQELLEAYSLQFCGGQQPVMRMYHTRLYRQEVMYMVLVDSPANQEQFSEYPRLIHDPNAVCCYRDGRFIWRPEAMCGTHRYELFQKDETRQMEARPCSPHERYVWDNVGIVLHVKEDKLLEFDPVRLREKLKFCEGERPRHVNVNLDPNELLERLWPEEA
ncbi:Ferredoxin--NADP reductase [Dissostichus eleginoides]|uniref:Ferredoxin--NADP reductase n=1 Tax=Dissostichus eleginoides TaxID=100907 RepID=A0AAD9BFU4_DISEL|nr:Ferredoxin--NADP reductase [Dissostichus eleginoides]